VSDSNKNEPIGDLERIHPEKEDSKLDISNELLTERLATSEKARKNAAAQYKKERFMLVFIAAAFFLLFIEAEKYASGWAIILTGLGAVLFLLWTLAKWSGFRAPAARLEAWLNLIYKIVEQHCLKKPPELEKAPEKYEDLPSDNKNRA